MKNDYSWSLRETYPNPKTAIKIIEDIYTNEVKVDTRTNKPLQGRIQGGRVMGVRTPPPPFGGPPNFIKREKTTSACAGKRHILVLNSYLDPPPPSPFPKSCIRPCIKLSVPLLPIVYRFDTKLTIDSLKMISDMDPTPSTLHQTI